MPTTLSNCCTQCKQYRDEVGVNGVWVSCANTLCECHVTPHQEGEEKCKRCGLLKSTVDAANIVCFSEEFHGVDISVTHDFSPNPHQEGGGRNLRDNKDGSCNCKPLGSSCFFTNWWTGGPCDCPCHTTPPTTKQGEECCDRDYPHEHLADGGIDISEGPLAKGLKKVLEAPTTQSWKVLFRKKFVASITSETGNIDNARAVIFFEDVVKIEQFFEQTLATALKEQEEKLVKALEAITFNGDDDSYLRGNRDGIKEAITLIKSTK